VRFAFASTGMCALLLFGCGGEGQPPEAGSGEEPAQEATAVASAEGGDQEAAPPRRRFLPDEMQRPGGRPGFSHDPHVEIACSVCHARVRGHGSHADLRCAQCHAASERATQRNVTAADCLACHHGAQQTATCTTCHQVPAPRIVERTIRLGVWNAGRVRRLPFDHARHEQERCEACHENRPSLAPTAACGACHEDHHRPDASCVTCHRPPSQGAHTLNAHLGCSGGGCHSDPSIDAIAQTRPVCLVCHQQQQNHEVGKECAECHQVRSQEATALRPSAHPWAPQRELVVWSIR
jgi:hypothetical protein